MSFFRQVQGYLEEQYGALTGLDIGDFVRPTPKLRELGKLLVETSHDGNDLNLALLLDRDIYAAFTAGSRPHVDATDSTNSTEARAQATATGANGEPEHRALSVTFEEISHFVYLSYNHNRGRNVTPIELELQSEIDRVLLAFHSGLAAHHGDAILDELYNRSYPEERYETARVWAARFVNRLCIGVSGNDPRAWTRDEFERLRRFFHSDLSEKLHLCRD